MIHELKTWVEYFEAVFSGRKTFEVRLNDRDFHEGDYLILKEWDNEIGEYTDRVCYRKVTYILHGGQLGLEAGHVVMSISIISFYQLKEVEIELQKGLKSI